MKFYIYIAHDREKHLTPVVIEGKTDAQGNPIFRTKIEEKEKVVFFEERHAQVYGSKMKEFVGVIETDDNEILSKTADELRAMNLPKTFPPLKQTRDQVIRQITRR